MYQPEERQVASKAILNYSMICAIMAIVFGITGHSMGEDGFLYPLIVLLGIGLLLSWLVAVRTQALMREALKEVAMIEELATEEGKFTIDSLFESIRYSRVIKERIAQGLEEQTYTITGSDNVFSKATEMLTDAQEEVLTIWVYPKEESPRFYSNNLEHQIEEDLRVVRLMNLNHPNILAEAQNLIRKFGDHEKMQIYHTRQVSSEILIVDGKQALLTFPTAKGVEIETAIYTDNPKMVRAVRDWYDKYLLAERNHIRSAEDLERFM